MLSAKSKEVICEFSIGKGMTKVDLRIPLLIPSSQCPRELAHRIIKLHNLPVFHHKALSSKLSEMIGEKNREFYKERDTKNMEALRNRTLVIDDIASFWGSKYGQEKTEDRKLENEDEMAAIYHSLAHSPSVHSLLSLEQTYADAVSTLVSQKEKILEELHNKQADEMQSLVKGVGSCVTVEEVNNLQTRHLEDSQLMEVKWDSTISALKEEQKREFKRFIAESYEGKEVVTPVTPKEFTGNNLSVSDYTFVDTIDVPVREESFTIHLGTQMKQMHNLRLLAADVMDLLRYQHLDDSDIPPQRIQTAMSLFSHNLNGIVLLVNDRVTTFRGITKEFGRICSRSTELHFPELEDQLEGVRNIIPEITQWRAGHPPPRYEGDEELQITHQVSQNLKSGDFYISRHSNLPDVHVVFHMVVDERLGSSDINSRHSVILGLRNVLKVACLGDITTLTVPLLLTHSLSEEMTISWCQKRAELVYKCIKGFMIEMSSWGGAEMKNLQFLVPKGISDDLFNNLASMLQSIFRLSNPLVIKSSGSKCKS
ncbi:UNVERIFIED_CONTAM: hypothetical protein RMT77_005118 [Armadillidium vulgare]